MHQPIELVLAIREAYWDTVSYPFAVRGIRELRESFDGEWPRLNRMANAAEKRADHSLLHLASLVRALDDRDGIDQFFSANFPKGFGTANLNVDDSSAGKAQIASEKLGLRAITNKVIHGAHYEWLMDDEITVRVYAHPADAKQKGRWVEANIHLARLLPVIGQLG